MKITSSYGVELRKHNIPIRQTLDVYRSAVSYLTEIYEQVWEELESIQEAKKRFNEAGHLIHTTKKNQTRFDFDVLFPKTLIVKVVVSKNIYFLFVQVIRYCSVPDVSINKLSTFIGNHVRHRILPDHHHFE